MIIALAPCAAHVFSYEPAVTLHCPIVRWRARVLLILVSPDRGSTSRVPRGRSIMARFSFRRRVATMVGYHHPTASWTLLVRSSSSLSPMIRSSPSQCVPAAPPLDSAASAPAVGGPSPATGEAPPSNWCALYSQSLGRARSGPSSSSSSPSPSSALSLMSRKARLRHRPLHSASTCALALLQTSSALLHSVVSTQAV